MTNRKMRVYWQGDSTWGLDDVGRGTSDMSAAGCLVTSMTMCRNWLTGDKLTPKDVNETLKKHPEVWVGSNMVIHHAARRLGLDAPQEARTRGAPGDPGLVEALRRVFDGSPGEKCAILHVSTDGGPKGRHFVVAYQDLDGQLQVADPALGRTIAIPLATLALDVHWRKVLKRYRVVSVVPVSLSR